jgi:hypothetical protein
MSCFRRLQTPFRRNSWLLRRPSDALQTLVKNPSDALQTPFRQPTHTSLLLRSRGGEARWPRLSPFKNHEEKSDGSASAWRPTR